MTAATIVSVLASAVIVLTGLAALVRAIWRVATMLRDNTRATQELSSKLDGLAQVADGRIATIEDRLARLEAGQQKA